MDIHERAVALIKGVKIPTWDQFNQHRDQLPLVEQLAWIKNFRDRLINDGQGAKFDLSKDELDQLEKDYESLVIAAETERQNKIIHEKVTQAIEKKRLADKILGKSKKSSSLPRNIFREIADENKN